MFLRAVLLLAALGGCNWVFGLDAPSSDELYSMLRGIPAVSSGDLHVSRRGVSADGRHLLFSVAPLAAPNDTDVYEATR